MTPVAAVLYELKKKHPDAELRFWCDTHFASHAKTILDAIDTTIPVQTILSGKFRRYHHLTRLQHLTIPSVVFPNIRDAFLVAAGTIQSFLRLLLWRPDVVFAKGGYVCLPVGWAAWLLRIPIVIHDSDAHPGLTNRLLAPLAKRIATGVPLEHYNYPSEKSVYIGIPIDAKNKKVSGVEQAVLKKQLGFDPKRPLIVVTGGGQGSRQINEAIAYHLDELLEFTNVILNSGSAQFDELFSLTPQNDPRFQLKDFVPSLVDQFAAADIVISRAGATALLELAAQAKPTILIPSKRLTWQVKHAKLFADKQAVLVLDEDKFENPADVSLVAAVRGLLTNTQIREKLAKNLHKEARLHAAEDMAGIIIRAARKKR